MSHTTGPWKWNGSGELVSESADLIVLEATRDPVHFDPIIEIATSADQSLIAAAPELLAALRALSGIHGSTLLSKRLSLSNEMAQANAEAILAKLEGV
jgi:hypothetical protein